MKKLNNLEDFIFPTQEELFGRIPNAIKGKKIIVTGKYILVCGKAPVMLLAQLDTVHKESVKTICASDDGNILMSPQGIGGDDRCGVYALIKAYREAPVKPWLLFTCDEECGGKGADAFARDYAKGNLPNLDHIKFLVEIDRRGSNDAVYYSLDNPEFEMFIEQYGFELDFGSYSDICDVAPAIGVAAVNLSSGYYQAHTQHEYINRRELEATISRVMDIIADSVSEDVPQFEYIEQPPRFSKVGYRYYYDQCKLDIGIPEDDNDVPNDVPLEFVLAYEDLLAVYSKSEIESMRKVYGNEVISELYDDAYGPFVETHIS